jgi:hypothetical protein
MLQLISILIAMAAWHQPGRATTTFPPVEEFARNVRQAMSRAYHDEAQFTYLERRRDIDISLLGKVTLGPVRTFEVYPSRAPGRTYKRLIAVDGRPLDADELARRDAEHARNLQEAAREGPRQRAARLRQEAEEQQQFEAMLDDAVAVYEPAFVGRDRIDGQAVLIADLRPRANAAVTTRQGGWMQHFRGRIWVAESDHQIVRLDMRAFRDITIGWGVVGRLDQGSRVLFSRRWFDGAWLPAELTYEASGRTLLVRPFHVAATTTYSDYRRSDAAAAPPRSGGKVNQPLSSGV